MSEFRFYSVVLCAYAATCATAGDWISPDGAISVGRPDAAMFVEVACESPLLVAWAANDTAVTVGVMRFDLPPGITLIRKGLEGGLVKDIQGHLIDSEERLIDGQRVFSMRARGTIQGKEVVVSQAIVAFGTLVYKVVANETEAATPNMRAAAQQFVGSLKINRPVKQADNKISDPQANNPFAIIVYVVDGVMRILLVVMAVFVLYSCVVLVRRWLNRHTTDARCPSWISAYTIAGVISLFLGMVGVWSNTKQIMAAERLPEVPAVRIAYIAGLFACPGVFLLLAAVLGLLARRTAVVRRSDDTPRVER